MTCQYTHIKSDQQEYQCQTKTDEEYCDFHQRLYKSGLKRVIKPCEVFTGSGPMFPHYYRGSLSQPESLWFVPMTFKETTRALFNVFVYGNEF